MSARESSSQNPIDPLRKLLDEKNLADEISKALEGNDCPGEAELEAYVRKELKDPARLEVKSHLTYCGRCQKRVQGKTSLPAGAAEKESDGASAKSFRFGRVPVLEQEDRPSHRSSRRRYLAISIVVGLALLAGGILYLRGGADPFFAVKIVQAKGNSTPRAGEEVSFEVRAGQPVYLIEIVIDGGGQIESRIPSGPHGGMFAEGDLVTVVPKAPGELDVYLVPAPADEGFPNRLLAGLLEFIKTEKTISRVNQRNGIETALSLYRARFRHEVVRVAP